MAHGIAFEGVWKVFKDRTPAIRDLNLEVNPGEFFVFLGPSGSGKTTLLRLVAGLESPTSGRILIGDRDVTDSTPKERDVAMVFQNYSLYPHMNVYENIAFGVRSQRLKKAEVDERVKRAAAILEIEQLLKKKPRALSGGQQQRVAMGRAIARDPALFLLDEPLSNLDARTRAHIRGEMAQIQRRVNVTTLYVTHDQTEAMSLGDRVGILRQGVLEQVATPDRLYHAPENLFVAGFVGSPPMNLAEATVEEADGDLFLRFGGHRLAAEKSAGRLREYAWRQVIVGIRPEDLHDGSDLGAHPGARMSVVVGRREVVGADVHLFFTVDAPLLLTEDPRFTEKPDGTQSYAFEQPNLWMARVSSISADAGDRVDLAVRPGRLYVFDPRTGDVVSR